MNVISALVLFAVVWFMVLFVTLPLRLRTQGDVGEVVRGTHAGAPADFKPRRTAGLVTIVSAVIWAGLVAIIWSGAVSVADISVFTRWVMGLIGETGA